MSLLILSQASVPYAEAMSAALWALARPTVGSDTTTQAVLWVQHPTTQAVALSLDGYLQRVDASADIDAFLGVLGSAGVPLSERLTLKPVLEAARGGDPLAVEDWLPASLQQNSITQSVATASGWFASP